MKFHVNQATPAEKYPVKDVGIAHNTQTFWDFTLVPYLGALA